MVREQRGNVGHESKNPYYEGENYKEPTYCPECDLIYREGRWKNGSLEKKSNKANEALCPACRREREKVPEGLVHLKGDYLEEHRQEILNIAQNRESQAQQTRPLQRIMWIKKDEKSIEIATTSEHLARRIGKAVKNAHDGELKINSGKDERLTRIYWRRVKDV